MFFSSAIRTALKIQLASVLNASAYLFTMLLSAWFLKDKISWQCAVGNALIVIGIVVYVC